MSQITIDARDARLAILGYQPEVTRIYWSALPEKLPTYGQTLDLSGCEITAIYVDGSEAVVTPYCTFSPDTGATVPNAKTMTITATYTARSGKVCEADETLPVCVPSYIKIIVPDTVGIIRERAIIKARSEPLGWSVYSPFFGFEDVYACLYWTRDSEVVAITRVPATFSTSSGFYAFGDGVTYQGVGLGHDLTAQTYERYFTPTRAEEVTADYACQIKATYSIYGLTFNASAYLESDIIDGVRLHGVPTTYSGTASVTITKDSNLLLLYMSGVAESCSYTDQPAGFYVPPYYNSFNISLGDGFSGSVPIAVETHNPSRLLTSASYNCHDGVVEWSPEGVII